MLSAFFEGEPELSYYADFGIGVNPCITDYKQ